jgi:hypothetical protein
MKLFYFATTKEEQYIKKEAQEMSSQYNKVSIAEFFP